MIISAASIAMLARGGEVALLQLQRNELAARVLSRASRSNASTFVFGDENNVREELKRGG